MELNVLNFIVNARAQGRTVKSQAQEVTGTRRPALGFLKAKKTSARISEAKKFFQEALSRVAESYFFVGLFSFLTPRKKRREAQITPRKTKISRSRSRLGREFLECIEGVAKVAGRFIVCFFVGVV